MSFSCLLPAPQCVVDLATPVSHARTPPTQQVVYVDSSDESELTPQKIGPRNLNFPDVTNYRHAHKHVLTYCRKSCASCPS